MIPVLILAGGLATRLGTATAAIPESMVDVAGEPFIAHQLRLLCRQNIRKVVPCVGHLGETVKTFVGDGHKFGVEVLYSFDGEQLLGTGGTAARAAAPW